MIIIVFLFSGLLDDTDTKEAFDFVEECINRQVRTAICQFIHYFDTVKRPE